MVVFSVKFHIQYFNIMRVSIEPLSIDKLISINFTACLSRIECSCNAVETDVFRYFVHKSLI